jgi:hypothetical protein
MPFWLKHPFGPADHLPSKAGEESLEIHAAVNDDAVFLFYVLKLDADILRDQLAARDNGDMLQHGFAATVEITDVQMFRIDNLCVQSMLEKRGLEGI